MGVAEVLQLGTHKVWQTKGDQKTGTLLLEERRKLGGTALKESLFEESESSG